MAATRRTRTPQYAQPHMPDFAPFQLCKLEAKPPAGTGWIHEIKFDGYRMQLRVERHRARLHTRNGHDWTGRFRALEAFAGELPDCILDGELCAIDEKGTPNFSALRSALAREDTDELVFFAFDILFEGRTDLRPFSLETRKTALAKVLDTGGEHIADTIRYVDPLPGSGAGLLNAACEMGLEGIVSKRLNAPYSDGRADTWIKTKCRPSEEVVIIGWRQEGNRFNSLIAGVPEGQGRLRYAGRIHSGYSAKIVASLMAKLRALETERSPATHGDIPKRADIHWVRPELVAEVEMAEYTASGKIRQGSFKGIREDKTVGNLTDSN